MTRPAVTPTRIRACLHCGAPLADTGPGHAVWCRPCSITATDAGRARPPRTMGTPTAAALIRELTR